MPIKHRFQSGRGDNGDAGGIQPSHWNGDHDISGMLALVDAVTPAPNMVFALDASGNPTLIPTNSIPSTLSPSFGGAPTAPTAPLGTNTTQIATMAAVQAAINALIDGAPGALNTLKELADAINDDASFTATVTNALTNRLRVDAAQGLSLAQQLQALANLGAPSLAGAAKFSGAIVESHAAGAATFAVKNAAGADPSAAAPVRFSFPNGVGGWTDIDVTSALSITIPSGANLGQTVNASAFRVWIAAFNDSGTVRLAVRTCASTASSPVTIISPAETRPASSTLTPANAAHTFYTTTSAVASKYWTWIAHATYESGLATAGTWAVPPDVIAIVNQSSRRPGDRVSAAYATGTSQAVTGTAYVDTNTAAPITPQSAANAVRFRWSGSVLNQSASNGFLISVHCDASATIFGGVALNGSMAVNTLENVSGGGIRAPLNTTAQTTFKVQIKDDTAGQSCTFGYGASVPEIEVEEIMT